MKMKENGTYADRQYYRNETWLRLNNLYISQKYKAEARSRGGEISEGQRKFFEQGGYPASEYSECIGFKQSEGDSE